MSETLLKPEQLVADYVRFKNPTRSGRSLATANWVTTLAHDCEAYAVYMRTVPTDKRLPMKESLGMIFSEGNDQARAMKRDLSDMGYEVEGAEDQVAWPQYQITGRQDFKIRKNGVKGHVFAELKSCSPFTYDSINSVDDIKYHKWPFIVKWWRQVCLYMLLKAVENYWMILKNKSTGQIKIIEFKMDDDAYKVAEWMTKKAETVNKLVQIGQMPSEAQKISAPDLCPECEFFAVCNPAIDFGVGAQIMGEEEALEAVKQLERRAEIEALADEYEDLDKALKTLVKNLTAPDGEQVVIGDWLASVSYQNVKEEKAPRKAFRKTLIKFTKLVSEETVKRDYL